MKKSKPKQRTNWKQRALHCEEVIGVQNELAKAAEVRTLRYIAAGAEAIKRAESAVVRAQKAESALDESGKQVNALRFRAESAEKHNALLLEERDAKAANRTVCSGCHLPYCHGECFTPVRFHGDKKLFEIGDVVETPEGTFTLGDPANPPKVHPQPTHRQRFKSFLKHWYVELLCLMVVICAVAGFVAFAWWKA